MAATETKQEEALGSRAWAALVGAAALTAMAGGAVVVARERSAAADASVAARPTDPGGPWDVALHVESGRLVVPVVVDGEDSLRFILDTAAESSAITAGVADRLRVEASRVRRMRVVGVGGARVMTAVSLRSVDVGGAIATGVNAIVVDAAVLDVEGRYDGLLGNDVLRRYDVEIDVSEGLLRLHPHTPPGLDGSRTAATLRMKPGREGFVSFDAQIGGVPVHAILDTGTPVSLLNWRAAELAGVALDSEGLRERGTGTVGLDGVATVTYEHRIEGLSFGGAPFEAFTVRIADLPLFRVAGVGASPAMLVGVDLLRRCPLLLSYSTRTVHACARPSA